MVGHELDVGAVFGCETSVDEVLLGEDGETVVEEIELDPFLVQAEGDGLEVEIRVDHVTWLRAVRAKSTSRCVRCWLDFCELTVRIVVSGGRVWWHRWYRLGGRSTLKSTCCCGGTRVWAVTSRTSDLTADNGWRNGRGSDW